MPVPSSTLLVKIVTVPSCTYRDPGIKLSGIGFSARQPAMIVAKRSELGGKEIEADDERAGAFEKLSAIEFDGLHRCAPFPYTICPEARLTALKMRICVPQRQRFPANASLIWPSLGLGFLSEQRFACS